MLHPDLTTELLRAQRREWLAAAEQRRRVAAFRPRIALSRRIARPLGRALVRIGAGMLRYGRAEARATTRPYHASARSIRLN